MDEVIISTHIPYREGIFLCFTSRENQCTHVGNNSKAHSVRQFRIDGEVFPKGKGPQRCDYLLVNDTNKTSFYIELKGSDIAKAIQQIDNSVRLISSSLPGYAIYRRIVYRSGTHGIKNSTAIRWRAKYKHENEVRIERTKIEDDISLPHPNWK